MFEILVFTVGYPKGGSELQVKPCTVITIVIRFGRDKWVTFDWEIVLETAHICFILVCNIVSINGVLYFLRDPQATLHLHSDLLSHPFSFLPSAFVYLPGGAFLQHTQKYPFWVPITVSAGKTDLTPATVSNLHCLSFETEDPPLLTASPRVGSSVFKY